MEIKHCDGERLKEMIVTGAELLDRRKKIVDNLSVFPIPDGDTGTNISRTLRAAAYGQNASQWKN